MYRLYNTSSDEHFYTATTGEKKHFEVGDYRDFSKVCLQRRDA
ncbi:hypothetical protein ACTXNW_12110 [Enterococcus malodoratus]